MEYFAPHTIHHGVKVPNSLGPRVSVLIPGGQFFDPAAFGLTEVEMAALLARRLILTREQWQAQDAREREARAGVLTDGTVATRIYPSRPPSMDSLLLTDRELDRALNFK